MPKLKTKSSAKKRFRITGNKIASKRKVISSQANKQHNMRKRSKNQLRRQRGTVSLVKVEARRIMQCLPYS